MNAVREDEKLVGLQDKLAEDGGGQMEAGDWLWPAAKRKRSSIKMKKGQGTVTEYCEWYSRSIAGQKHLSCVNLGGDWSPNPALKSGYSS